MWYFDRLIINSPDWTIQKKNQHTHGKPMLWRTSSSKNKAHLFWIHEARKSWSKHLPPGDVSVPCSSKSVAVFYFLSSWSTMLSIVQFRGGPTRIWEFLCRDPILAKKCEGLYWNIRPYKYSTEYLNIRRGLFDRILKYSTV